MFSEPWKGSRSNLGSRQNTYNTLGRTEEEEQESQTSAAVTQVRLRSLNT